MESLLKPYVHADIKLVMIIPHFPDYMKLLAIACPAWMTKYTDTRNPKPGSMAGGTNKLKYIPISPLHHEEAISGLSASISWNPFSNAESHFHES